MVPFRSAYSADKAAALKEHIFDRQALDQRGLATSRLCSGQASGWIN